MTNCPTCKNPILIPALDCEWCGSKIITPNNKIFITSPMRGKFKYSLINEGDNINEGTPICVIESDNLCYEIESLIVGKVKKIIQKNDTKINIDDPLYLIENN